MVEWRRRSRKCDGEIDGVGGEDMGRWAGRLRPITFLNGLGPVLWGFDDFDLAFWKYRPMDHGPSLLGY